MNVEQINHIEDVIQLEKGKKILHHTVKRLTAPGENYGSLMLSVGLTVATQNGTEQIDTVAKMVPPNAFIQQIFNTQVTFRNEIGFYKSVIPTLQDFEKERGKSFINFSPKCYGGRANLKDDGGLVDSDAVLVLENLRVADYVNLERTEGLDLETTKLVLTNLAYLHGVALALKLRKPEVFERKIKPYLSQWFIKEAAHSSKKKDLIGAIDQVEEVKPLKDRILIGFEKELVEYKPREPFATVAHNDLWTNNCMFVLEGDKPVKNILVDYQVCSYGSPARDVIFFLFTSVKNHIIESHYDELIKFYHQKFLTTLQQLGCDTTPFEFEAFEKELDFEGKHSQFSHILFMLFPIYAHGDKVKDFDEIAPGAMFSKDITDLFKAKFVFTIKQFIKRNWV